MNRKLLNALILSAATLAACGGGGSTDATTAGSAITTTQTDGSLLTVAADGTSSFSATTLASSLTQIPAVAPLSVAESSSLLWMREEEKLAHDVYVFLYAKWGLTVFNNISASETTHTEAVKALLDRYSLADPAAGKAPGQFTNTTLQGIYDTLVAKGSASVVDALLVGAEIEDLDIRDIETQKEGIDNADILLVYDNLLTGSRNHLRAFVKVLATYSVTYTPKYISQATFDAIVSSSTERGASR